MNNYVVAELTAAVAGFSVVVGFAYLLASSSYLSGNTVASTVSALVSAGRRLQQLVGIRGQSVLNPLSNLLERAGLDGRVSARDLLAVKFSLVAVSLAVVGMATVSGSFGRLGLLLILVVPAYAFFLPDVWLRRRVRQREERITTDLPDFLELLRVSVVAGLPLQRALAETAERFKGPLAAECRRVAVEHSLGLAHRRSLRRLSERVRLQEVADFITAVEQSAKHGVPLGETLLRQARSAREARRLQIKDQAAKAGPKIQLVIATVMVPAVLMLFAAAVAAQLMSGSGANALFG